MFSNRILLFEQLLKKDPKSFEFVKSKEEELQGHKVSLVMSHKSDLLLLST